MIIYINNLNYTKYYLKNNRFKLEKSKNYLINIYKKECIQLNLNLESIDFLTKKEIVDLFFTNPINYHFYSYNNKYFISNTKKF